MRAKQCVVVAVGYDSDKHVHAYKEEEDHEAHEQRDRDRRMASDGCSNTQLISKSPIAIRKSVSAAPPMPRNGRSSSFPSRAVVPDEQDVQNRRERGDDNEQDGDERADVAQDPQELTTYRENLTLSILSAPSSLTQARPAARAATQTNDVDADTSDARSARDEAARGDSCRGRVAATTIPGARDEEHVDEVPDVREPALEEAELPKRARQRGLPAREPNGAQREPDRLGFGTFFDCAHLERHVQQQGEQDEEEVEIEHHKEQHPAP